MSPEDRELLQRSVELAEENNDILRAIRRSMRFARIMSILYWVVIIGSAIGAFYLIQPYLDALSNIYGGAKGGLGEFGDIIDSFNNLNK